jgi:hypothetical protein
VPRRELKVPALRDARLEPTRSDEEAEDERVFAQLFDVSGLPQRVPEQTLLRPRAPRRRFGRIGGR